MGMIRNLIEQIGIFMICAQAVVHFRPKEAYGKYLRLLLGLMALVQIFSPVYGLFFGEEGVSVAENIREFQEEMEGNMAEAAERSAISDLQLEDMSLKVLREIVGAENTAKEESKGAVAEVEIEIAPIEVGRGEP